MKLVFLLEEPSLKVLLDILLPRILPNDIDFQTIPHAGKSDLVKSIPNKLRGWNEPDVKFIIVHDQDTNDCIALKRELEEICKRYDREFLIRIVCHELESWYFGDLQAVSEAFDIKVDDLERKKKYRVPDNIISPKQELNRLLPQNGQLERARMIGEHMRIDRNKSHSFRVFVDGVRRMAEIDGYVRR